MGPLDKSARAARRRISLVIDQIDGIQGDSRRAQLRKVGRDLAQRLESERLDRAELTNHQVNAVVREWADDHVGKLLGYPLSDHSRRGTAGPAPKPEPGRGARLGLVYLLPGWQASQGGARFEGACLLTRQTPAGLGDRASRNAPPTGSGMGCPSRRECGGVRGMDQNASPSPVVAWALALWAPLNRPCPAGLSLG